YRRVRRSCKRLPRANDHVSTVALEHVRQTGVVGARKLSGGWLRSTVARTSLMTRGVAAGILNKWLRVPRGPACAECDQGGESTALHCLVCGTRQVHGSARSVYDPLAHRSGSAAQLITSMH